MKEHTKVKGMKVKRNTAEPDVKEQLRLYKIALQLALDGLQDIRDICVGYDGYSSADELRGLIDDISSYSGQVTSNVQEQLPIRDWA